MMFIFSLISIGLIIFAPKVQISDFGNFWYRAPGILKGDHLFYTDTDYFAKWAYQTGFMAYLLALIKIFGHTILPVQILNILYQLITILLAYCINLKIFNNVKMARIGTFLLIIDFDWFALSSQADNQYLGSMFFLLTFYLILQDKYWSYLLAGISLALGAIVRPIGPVIIAGIIVFAFFYKIISNNKFHLTQVWKLLITLLVYFLVFNSAGLLIKSSGLNQYGLSNRDSGWKFVIGLNHATNGTYDQALFDEINIGKNNEQITTKEKQIIKQEASYLTNNHQWLNLFQNKISTSWSGSTDALDFTGLNKKISNASYTKITWLGYLGSIMIIIFSWIGSISFFKTKHQHGLYLLILPLLAFAVAQLFIEVQGRYRIEFIPILSIIGGVGLTGIFNYLHALKNKNS